MEEEEEAIEEETDKDEEEKKESTQKTQSKNFCGQSADCWIDSGGSWSGDHSDRSCDSDHKKQ